MSACPHCGIDASEVAQLLEEVLGDDPLMPSHEDTIHRAEVMIETLGRAARGD